MSGECCTLFLDFDGVMVTRFSSSDGTIFDSLCAQNLRQVIESLVNQHAIDVHLVITSNWRFDYDDKTLISVLKQQVMLDDLHSNVVITVLDRNYSKAVGIMRYILDKQLSKNSCIILDDECLGDDLAPYLLQTRAEDGLRSIEIVDAILAFLKKA